MKKEGLTFPESVERLAEIYGVPMNNIGASSKTQEQRDTLFQVNSAAARLFHDLLLNSPQAEKARQYLGNRGVSSTSVSDFQLGFALPDWQHLKEHLNSQGYQDEFVLETGLLAKSDSGRIYDRFRDKLMIPIFDHKSRVIGFGARTMDDTLPKYINSPDSPTFSKSAALFGINMAVSDIRKSDQAIIVEGYFDVIASHQAGFKNTVASMGTAITESQVNTLRKLTKNIILALDADEAGAEAMARSLPHEAVLGNELKVAVAPAGQDPDDIIRKNPEDWNSLIGEAKPLMEFIIERTSHNYDLKTAGGKSKFSDEILNYIAAIKDPVRKGHYLAELSRKVAIDTAELQYGLNRLKRTSSKASPERVGPAIAANSTSIEDYLLSIYIRHPELRATCQGMKAEFFAGTENREIFKKLNDTSKNADSALVIEDVFRPHYDYLMSIQEPKALLQERLTECALRIEEKYLKSTASNIKTILENLEPDAIEESERCQHRLILINQRLADIFRSKNELLRRSRR
jgi:DNA primase